VISETDVTAIVAANFAQTFATSIIFLIIPRGVLGVEIAGNDERAVAREQLLVIRNSKIGRRLWGTIERTDDNFSVIKKETNEVCLGVFKVCERCRSKAQRLINENENTAMRTARGRISVFANSNVVGKVNIDFRVKQMRFSTRLRSFLLTSPLLLLRGTKYRRAQRIDGKTFSNTSRSWADL
jgi:hypothetical protein